MGFKGVKIIQACFCDEVLFSGTNNKRVIYINLIISSSAIIRMNFIFVDFIDV